MISAGRSILLLLLGLLLSGGITAPAARADDSVSPQTQAQIDKALQWLARQQRPDGCFPSGHDPSTAITSFATMAFLARGHMPGEGPYGEVLYKAIDFVIKSQQENGLISANQERTMYDHGISTVMLCEVYGIVDDERRAKLDTVLAKSVKLILDAQKATTGVWAGGWRYQPGSQDADISVTGWQLMALRGAANCGAAVPKTAIDAGVAYVKRSAHPGGGFGYQPGGEPSPARTGTGILSMSLLGQHGPEGAPEAIAGGEYLLKHPLNNRGGEFYYYTVYYCSQAVNQLGGKYWDGFYPTLRDTLLKGQAGDGSWQLGSSNEQAAGACYSTSMAVLALCVPYHYLPLYQK